MPSQPPKPSKNPPAQSPPPAPAVSYAAVYCRSKGTFTLQKTVGEKTAVVFDSLPARSGQPGAQHVEWIPRKSPIPYGTWRLHTDSIKAGKDETYDGIGEFFPISSGDNRNILQGPGPNQIRTEVGLHWENKFPGSWGCIVLVDSSDEQRDHIRALFKTLRDLPAAGIKQIPLHVVS